MTRTKDYTINFRMVPRLRAKGLLNCFRCGGDLGEGDEVHTTSHGNNEITKIYHKICWDATYFDGSLIKLLLSRR